MGAAPTSSSTEYGWVQLYPRICKLIITGKHTCKHTCKQHVSLHVSIEHFRGYFMFQKIVQCSRKF